jgi:hypothetical protein
VTAIATPITTSEAFWSAAVDETGPGSISFDRCVDWLLDLYQSTDDADLRVLITEVLDDLRGLGPIEGEFEDVVLGALVSIEVAFEVRTGAR